MNAIQALSAQPWVGYLGWALIHFLWQGALIAALYVIARRSRTPQVCYMLACASLAAMAIAPMITFGLMAIPESAASNPFVGTVPVSSTNATELHPPFNT